MRNIIIAIFSVILLLLLCVACGGKKTDATDAAADADTAGQQTRLARALSEGRIETASAMADSMSLFVDDLTPDQTVQVLTAFLSVHNRAVEQKDRRRDLETLRKFVDVYDIALSINPSDMRSAFEAARRANPAVDIDSVARSFREILSQYDAIQDGSLVNDDLPADTDSIATGADSTAVDTETLPLELRPAE